MRLPGPQFLGLTYLASEILLSVTRRSRGDGVRQDRSTLRMLWVVIMSSIFVAILIAINWRAAALPHPYLVDAIGFVIFVLGVALRWWAIIMLGRFFTVDVQIAKDHELVERGPFRFVRHPSYTGSLFAFLGFALSLDNWASLLVIMLAVAIAFVRRMTVEEEALSAALGPAYIAYMQRTKRLIPGIY